MVGGAIESKALSQVMADGPKKTIVCRDVEGEESRES